MAKAKYQYVDKEVVLELLKNYGISDEDVQYIYEDTSSSFIEYTKKLCNLYLKYLNEGTDSALDTAYSLGGIIIFNLRKFILKKDITLLMGGTDAMNNNLKISEIPLTELLNNPSTFKISQEALNLNNAIESYSNLIKQVDRQQSAVWKKILDASQLTGEGDFDATKPVGKISLRDGGTRDLYRRLRKDTNVYYGYASKNIYSYYKLNNEQWYQFFNRGWLFEHFMNKWMNATSVMREDMIKESCKQHPVAIAMDNTDNIPGYKGGDFRYGKTDYQAKYGNTQIITIKSIEKVMKEIINLLNQYELEKRQTKRNLSEGLVKLFTDKNNIDIMLDQVNESYDEKLEEAYKDFVKTTSNSLSRRI